MINHWQLQYIVETVESEFNLTKAAEKLFISQPALSKSILNLESQLGGNLFLRKKGRLVGLTNLGSILYNYGKRILLLHQEMEDKIEIAQSESKHLVRLGILYVFMKLIFQDIKPLLMAVHAETALEITESDCFDIKHKFDENLLDIIITIRMSENEKEIYRENLLTSEYVVVFDQKHPFFAKKDLSYQDLNGQTIVLPSELNYSKQLIEKKLLDENIHPKKVIHMFEPLSIIEAILGTSAVCILPKIFIDHLIQVKVSFRRFDQPLAWYMDLVMHAYDAEDPVISACFSKLLKAIRNKELSQ